MHLITKVLCTALVYAPILSLTIIAADLSEAKTVQNIPASGHIIGFCANQSFSEEKMVAVDIPKKLCRIEKYVKKPTPEYEGKNMNQGQQKKRSAENNFGIVPQPFAINSKTGQPFKITAVTDIVYENEESSRCAEYLQERIEKATGMKLKLKTSGESNAIILKTSTKEVEFKEEEAYYLESNENRIIIIGKTPRGLFCGIQSLLQLLPAEIYSSTTQTNLNLTIDALKIMDKPVINKIRGLHVDISRHFRTKDELLKIIDCMVIHKLNTLHLHLTDDQGWRVEIKAFPKLTTIGAVGNNSDSEAPPAFLTQQEVREICAYAEKHYVSIIPEIDMPGHMAAAIRAYPELKNPREIRDSPRVIHGDKEAIDFAKKVLNEVNELFDPEYIHVGFDEVNYGAESELFSDDELVKFAKNICTFIKSDLKKIPIVWDDIFVKGWHDKETIVQWWRYDKVHWWKDIKLRVDEALNIEKQPFILSPAYWTYFDMPHTGDGGWAGSISTAEMYNWDPFGDMSGVTGDTRDLVQGAIACTWSENIPTMHVFGERTFPRLAAYCERLWSGGKSNNASILAWEDYRDKVIISYQLSRYDALDINYWGKDDPSKLKGLKNAHKKLK